VDALPCRRRSFRQVWYKSPLIVGEISTDVQKSLHSAMVKKMKK